MSETKRFSKESLYYLGGESLSKSLGFLLLPIYVSYLSIEEFALLSLVRALWPVIVIFLGQGFATYLTRGYFEYADKRRFFGTILLLSLSFGAIMASAIHVIGPWLFGHIFKNVSYKPYLQYGVFFAIFRLYFVQILSYFRAKREPKVVVLLSLLLFASNLIAVLVAIYAFNGKLSGILNAQLIGYSLVAVVFTIRIFPEVSCKFQFSVITPALLFVAPLVPHALAGWTVSEVSKIFIERYMTLADVAVYSISIQLAMILSVINSGLNQAWVPFVYENYEKDRNGQLLSLIARKMLLLSLLVCTALVLFAKELLQVMGKASYMSASHILPVLTISYVFQLLYLIHVAVIIYNKQPKLLPFISVIAGGLMLVLNVLLIPRFGVSGAAVSMQLSWLMMALLARMFSRRYIHLQVFNVPVSYFLVSCAAAMACSMELLGGFHFIQRLFINVGLLSGLIFVLLRLKLLKLASVKELFLTN